MMGYYENPELKRSSCVILILTLFFIFITFFIVNKSYEKIKYNYMNNNMAVVGRIVKTHPELKNEIIPIITKGSSKRDIESGRQILKEYGYSESLNINLIPELNFDYRSLIKSMIVSIICFFGIIFLINNIEYIKIYKKLESITLAAKNILDYKFDIGIYENTEGAFGKLAYAFNNMRVILKNNFSQIQEEKIFLVDTLSDISHQIKTPISSLIIYNDILLNRKVNEQKRIEFLESSKNQLNRIQWLVKSLLQLARLDAGAIKFKNENADINKTVIESVKSLKAKAENSKVNLEFHSLEKEIIVKHDVNWVCEAIINIIKNAIDHTNSDGKVEVFTEKTNVCVRVIVKDNGEGISSKEIKHIFERFYKGQTNKNAESVGIGLALSKSIIEGNGGIIDVKSKVDEGTTFTITFLNIN